MMFSVVIPTRARPDTLRHALKTVLAQTDGNFEVIVHESGNDPGSAAVVAEFDDERIRFFKTDEPVRMAENWERALARARGDYVCFIGDDDALLPDACAVARSILQAHPSEILSWSFARYCWPRYFDPEMANRLFARCGEKTICRQKDSRFLLELFYRFRTMYDELPMMYNSFVSRTVIDRVLASHGRYFTASFPDIAAGVANLYFSRVFLHCNRPLSLNAASHHSTGHALIKSGDAEMQARAVATAFGEIPVHPTLVLSSHWILAFANEMLIVKQALFPSDDLELDYRRMLEEAARLINETPGQYDAIVADCRAIARKNSIAFDESLLPPREPPPKPPRRDLRKVQFGTVFIELDGSSRGFANVCDAAAALAQQLPPATTPEFVVDAAPHREVVFNKDNSAALDFHDPVTLDFSSRGDGVLLLGLGWSFVESWGVWSIGTRAEIHFPIAANSCGYLTLRLCGPVFLPPRNMSICAKLGPRLLAQRQMVLDNARLDIELASMEIEPSDSARNLEIIITINESTTPMEAGISPDARRLGFGLERAVIHMAQPARDHRRV